MLKDTMTTYNKIVMKAESFPVFNQQLAAENFFQFIEQLI